LAASSKTGILSALFDHFRPINWHGDKTVGTAISFSSFQLACSSSDSSFAMQEKSPVFLNIVVALRSAYGSQSHPATTERLAATSTQM
jgi:hypothetical protein